MGSSSKCGEGRRARADDADDGLRGPLVRRKEDFDGDDGYVGT